MNQTLVLHVVRTQATQTLSALEAEFNELVSTATEPRGAQSLLAGLTGSRPSGMVECDDTTAIKNVKPKGLKELVNATEA